MHLQTPKDNFPARHRKTALNVHEDSDNSPPRTMDMKTTDSDNSPPRDQINSSLTMKTMDGKKAGLQSTSSLRSEMDLLRGEEKKRLNALSSEISGKGAQTVIRRRLIDKREEEEKRKSKTDVSKEVQMQYARCSKGQKQMENDCLKVKKDRHEMGKPFARLEDDKDMNDQLKAIERKEDPMLSYILRKRKKITSSFEMQQYPEYKGPPPPRNRFGITPGYRWDGVDRSTCFEKQLFEHSNK